jgi:D-serine deaminase-like pyridoxal phosphate-dependent protein
MLPPNVEEIERAAAAAEVAIDVPRGNRRRRAALRGDPGAAAAQLALRVAAAMHLNFKGCRPTTARPSTSARQPERQAQIARAVAHVEATLGALEAVGLKAAIVSGAGTGTFEHEAASRVYNELQPGSYVFMDADYARNKRG